MINIRPVHPTEWPILQKLNDAVFKDNAKYDPDIITDWAFSEAGAQYFQKVAQGTPFVCFVAEVDGQVVGYVAAQPKVISYRKSTYFEIENIGVLPEFRSRGLGYQLMEACKDWAKTHGYQRLTVNCYSRNEAAQAFYKKCGFGEIDKSLEMSL